MNKRTTTVVGLATALSIILSGCSTTASDSSGSGSTGGGAAGDLQTDVGVTDDTITLGALTDASGPFRVGGLMVTYGNQIWAEEINEAGGICGREIVLDVKDTGYQADKAVPLYDTLNGSSLGIIQMIGSAVFAALKQKMVNDQFMAWSPTIASANLDVDVMLTTGASFDVEAINGLSYLLDQGMIAKGDKIGVVYLDNEAGQNALLGAKSFAKEHDVQLVEAPIAASDTDLTSTVTKFKSDGVTAVMVAATPGALSSVAVQMKGQGLDIPIYGWASAFQPAILANAEVAAALDNFYMTGTNVVYNADNPKAAEIRAAYEKMGIADVPSASMIAGYLAGVAWGAILEQACEDGDMTRAGVMEARTKITALETDGLTGPLDFSDPGAPVTREVVIAQVDTAAPGGLKEVEGLFASEEAKAYKTPYEK